jgi:beta-fructofuranosidase
MGIFSDQPKLTREDLAHDLHRPQYHFLPPPNWMNDPNGLIQWKGQYHLFYQYNPNGPFWGTIHWGHATSRDLVHWTDRPIALAPTPGGADENGCWSGCAIDHDGMPSLIYTGVSSAAGPPDDQRPCLATSADDDLLVWHKHPGNPIIRQPPSNLALTIFRDHCVWHEDDGWYQIIGAGLQGGGGAALLYRSQDLRQWDYLHPLCIGDQRDRSGVWTGTGWECPQLIALNGQRYLLFSAWDNGHTLYSVCLTGDYRDHRFIARETYKLDWGDHYYYAPQVMVDDQGRHLMWGWIQEGRSREAQIAAGWSGVMSLPRILSQGPDKRVNCAPAPEMHRLRADHFHLGNLKLSPQSGNPLDEIEGDCLELLAEFEHTHTGMVELKLRCAPDGAEETLLSYEWTTDRILLDRTRSSLDVSCQHAIQGGLVGLSDGEPLRLHVFLDRSVIEIFVNGRFCLTSRIYPTRHDSQRVSLSASGSYLQVRSLDVWSLRSIWSA